MKKFLFIGIGCITLILIFLGFYFFNNNTVYAVSIHLPVEFKSSFGGYNYIAPDININCEGYMSDSSIDDYISKEKKIKIVSDQEMKAVIEKIKENHPEQNNIISGASEYTTNENKILIVTSRWTWYKIKNDPIDVIKYPQNYTNIKIYNVY